jgi:hypothetical protein
MGDVPTMPKVIRMILSGLNLIGSFLIAVAMIILHLRFDDELEAATAKTVKPTLKQ